MMPWQSVKSSSGLLQLTSSHHARQRHAWRANGDKVERSYDSLLFGKVENSLFVSICLHSHSSTFHFVVIFK
jgi:hypothetical protein